MSSSPLGLNAAVNGITAVGTHLAPCLGDPGTTGANIDPEVAPLAATWADAADGAADSVQVSWPIPTATLGEPRSYSHFAVLTDDAPRQYVTGGAFDTVEQFSDNGGTLRFTGTLTAEDAE